MFLLLGRSNGELNCLAPLTVSPRMVPRIKPLISDSTEDKVAI